MTPFEERERAFERRVALDQELKFKAEARRNKLLGEWAASKLGLSGSAVGEYIGAVNKTHVAKGSNAIFRKILEDFKAKGITVTAYELRKTMQDFLAKALMEIEGKA